MDERARIRRAKKAAKRVLDGEVSWFSVGVARVGTSVGLLVRVPVGEGVHAGQVLSAYGWPVPIEVAESVRPRARAASGTHHMHHPRVQNFLGEALGIKSIHPPPDPNVRVLGPDARAFWESVRDDALDYYSSAGAPKPTAVAERTAWRAVRMHWHESRGKRVRNSKLRKPNKMLLPDPGDVIILGKLLEYVWINEDGSLDVRRWTENPPDLYWNHEQKTLYAFPNVPDIEVCEQVGPDLDDTAAMFKRWAQRDAQCARTFELDAESSILPMGVGDSLAYRSDKWHARSDLPHLDDSQEYFHQFSDGVWIWQDSDTSPNAILMRGGQLDVEERGIIH